MSDSIEKVVLSSEDDLLRRVFHPLNIKDNGIPTSDSFKLRKGEIGLSVDIKRLTEYSISIRDDRKFRLFSLNAGFVHSLDLTTEHAPLPDNVAHALIKGKITRGISRKLARNAVRIPYPD